MKPLLRAGYNLLSHPFAAKVSDALLMARYKAIASKASHGQLTEQQPNTDAPKITVVVPVYNVERYLALCLQSLVAQNYPNLAVIAVNDGSTDGSLKVAQSFAGQLNLTIVDQANAGLGAARNAGVRAITATDYLMFLDSDDALTPNALHELAAQATKTNSDFVVGDVLRIKGLTRIKRVDTRQVFAKGTLSRTTLAQHPAAIQDVTAWNRLFKFSFWQHHEFEFPTGVFFEDMTLMTRAYLVSNSFDILAKPVYLWRVRTEGAKSITQQTNDTQKLADRLLSLRQIKALLESGLPSGRTNQANIDAFKARVQKHDIKLYENSVPGSAEQFAEFLG